MAYHFFSNYPHFDTPSQLCQVLLLALDVCVFCIASYCESPELTIDMFHQAKSVPILKIIIFSKYASDIHFA